MRLKKETIYHSTIYLLLLFWKNNNTLDNLDIKVTISRIFLSPIQTYISRQKFQLEFLNWNLHYYFFFFIAQHQNEIFTCFNSCTMITIYL